MVIFLCVKTVVTFETSHIYLQPQTKWIPYANKELQTLKSKKDNGNIWSARWTTYQQFQMEYHFFFTTFCGF